MLAIGVVNAGILGGVIGEGWRQKNSVGLLPKFGGWIMVVLGSTGMVLWNLARRAFSGQHARRGDESCVGCKFPGRTIGRRHRREIPEQPLGLEGFFSWVLAAVGVGCCVYAATKWLKRDDVYPGFGRCTGQKRSILRSTRMKT